ncbi:MAG: hypothetical protein RQ990_07005, partial [Candidatus Hydrothermia bacterium]|nr:hypothetical protein [Candidatus Hydrothermia bacterium]
FLSKVKIYSFNSSTISISRLLAISIALLLANGVKIIFLSILIKVITSPSLTDDFISTSLGS